MVEPISIASVAREAGISKEVLRKWEERYGFPVPSRDLRGRRVYGVEQAARLKLIKRLIDQGMRPAQVVPLGTAQLQELLSAKGEPAETAPDLMAWADGIVQILQMRQRSSLIAALQQELVRFGLERFIVEALPALNRRVGEGWHQGTLAIRDEHLYTEVVQDLIRPHLIHPSLNTAGPRLLLTTPSGELHILGLLMVQALATLHGAHCISLGAQTPLEELVHAAADVHADIVCLGFSSAYPRRRVLPVLKSLRASLPKPVEIWVGGAGAAALDHSPRGIQLLSSLPQVVQSLQAWQERARSNH